MTLSNLYANDLSAISVIFCWGLYRAGAWRRTGQRYRLLQHLLRYDFKEYRDQRKNLVEVLNYLPSMEIKSSHWKEDGRAARLVSGAVENDHV